MLILSRALKKDKCTNCTTTFSTTLVVLYNKTRITATPAEMFLHTRNGFEIDPVTSFLEIKAIWLAFDSLIYFTTEHLIFFFKRGKKVQTTPY